jgi:hypothetical protein
MQKNTIISFAIGLAVGILGTASVILAGRSGPAGDLAGLDRANQQRTTKTVADLERVIGEQRERIDGLEASNSRLNGHIRDARGIVEQLAVSTGSEAIDIRSAITLLKKITDQVKSLNSVLGGEPPGGDSGDGLADMEDL